MSAVNQERTVRPLHHLPVLTRVLDRRYIFTVDGDDYRIYTR